jgi:hypothetical protein
MKQVASRTIGGIAAISLLSACGARPHLLRHYEQFEGLSQPRLELSVFMANPKAGESKAPILGLHERAQAALVNAMAERAGPSASSKQLVAAVMDSPEEEQRPCAWADRTVLSKRVVFTLLGELSKPADRVDKLEIFLKLTDAERGRFTSWDRFDSVYASIDIGSAKFTQTDKLTLGQTKSVTAGDLERVLDIGVESQNALEETAKYALRRLSLGGALTSDTAKLVLEGGPLLNLFGTATATVSLRLSSFDDNMPVYRLNLRKDGKLASPAEVTVERCQAKVARSAGTGLSVESGGRAWIREAVSGDSTVSEGDDRARIRIVALTGPRLELSTADELHAEAYGLIQCSPRAALEQCTRVRIEAADYGPANSDVLQFASAANAAQFRLWLVEQTQVNPVIAVAGRRVGLAGQDDATTSLTGVTKLVAGQLRVARLWENK